MRYLTLAEVLELHRRVIEQSGGALGVRDLGGVESAIAQPQMTFGGNELYPTIEHKAAALCYSLVMNHPFVDGNKRIGHAAMETFLVRRSSLVMRACRPTTPGSPTRSGAAKPTTPAR